MAATMELERDRISRVFQFLKGFNQIKNPVPRVVTEHWHLWLHDVPTHPLCHAAPFTDEIVPETGASDQDENVVLRVRRPRLSDCPTPPIELNGWLQDGWRDVSGDVQVFATRASGSSENPVIERFSDSAERLAAFKKWEGLRSQWVERETPLRAVDQLFQRLYALHGELQRESEKSELVLGDGHLVWKRREGDVHHPLLIAPLQLEFDADLPEFRVVESDRPVELYSALLGTFDDVDGSNVVKCRDELSIGGVHPLNGASTNGFLKRLALTLSGQGVVLESASGAQPREHPQVYRRPVLFLRSRATGFARAIESILEDVERTGSLAASLERIVGVARDGATDWATSKGQFAGGDVLLSKQANLEQVQIVERLDKHGAVLVQGPPGTGKSHTIGNLIGHLLAHGQTVLVTSHTTKALRVLRDHVVPELRPLCVSVLENDVESRRELESAVTNIADRLSNSDKDRLTSEALSLEQQRKKLKATVEAVTAELRDSRLDEQRELIVDGRPWRPIDAAKFVREGAATHAWIPGAVAAGTSLPLTPSELDELYASNAAVSVADERDLSQPIPDLTDHPLPARMTALLERVRRDPEHMDAPGRWSQPPEATDEKQLEHVAESLVALVEQVRAEPVWFREAVVAGMTGGGARSVWENLAQQIDDACALRLECAEHLLKYEPELPSIFNPDEAERIASEILARVSKTGNLGAWDRATHRVWAKFVGQARAGGATPTKPEHFAALKFRASLVRLRGEIGHRWSRLMEPGGAPAWKDLGDEPEASLGQIAQVIRRALAWTSTELEPELVRLASLGLRWDELLSSQPALLGKHASLDRLMETVTDALPPLVAGRIEAAMIRRADGEIQACKARLQRGVSAVGPLASALVAALEARDTDRYRRAYDRIVELRALQQTATRRADLLNRLYPLAPGWAEAIRQRRPPHDRTAPPGNVQDAWTWAQLHLELERRAQRSIPELQRQLEELESQLRDVTVALIDRRAWTLQMERTKLAQQQALVGWLDLVRRIGKGTGKRAPALRAAAAGKMRECRTAVPVWIMPLARVADMFDGSTRFDVVIIDEASQCDIMGLVALYLGKRVVVVGDHEQVSPTAVGQQIGRVQQLINQHLTGIPNNELYDGKASIYDLARQSFGGLICLTEHFRCFPEIIDFSNWLSYEGRIKPLREPSTAKFEPFVVPYAVQGAFRSDKLNPTEAQHVASLLVACTRQPEYCDATFGVVSLLGDDQAMEIDRLLRAHLSESEYVRRRVLCGNAAHFQGDERDVMFLSLVYAPMGAPLSMMAEPMYQQRFNVAASRARDQMWVAHSVDPNLDLKPEDLRRKLIEHARDPGSRARLLRQAVARTESDFERRVVERLISLGYSIRTQHAVGAYRIDLVVEGNGQRLAVECDGERFHTLQNLDDDMKRQAILERLGWRFVRIRGSLFYRDPDRAMRPVLERLASLGVQPSGASTSQAPASGLFERVLNAAAQLRAEWSDTPRIAQVRRTSDDVLASVGAEARAATTQARHGPSTELTVQAVAEPSLPPSVAGAWSLRAEAVPRMRALGAADALASSAQASYPVAPELTVPVAADGAATPALRAAVTGGVPVPRLDSSGWGKLILDALWRRTPDTARVCPVCHNHVVLKFSRFGPYLPCTTAGCIGKNNVDASVLREAVNEASLRCECGGTFVLRRGKSWFLGCDSYPSCARTLSWRDL